jgi:amino acid transporter
MTDQAIENLGELIPSASSLRREINWIHAVGIATGVPALVLFSIGAIASTVGSPSWAVWIISVLIGTFQMFTYAEVVGMFSNKSGGAAVAGSLAWLPYSKAVPAVSAWCYWLAWSPVLAIGTTIASGYILTSFFPATSLVNTWQVTLVDLHFIQPGLTLRVNANFLVSAILLLVVFLIQHGGILRAARFQVIFAVASLLPLGIIGILPLITGRANLHELLPLVPLAHDAAGKVIPGKWDMAGITLFVGALGLAAWSSYGIEACLVYAREFKKPSVDVIKASLATVALCLFFYAIVPISFQAFLGLTGISDPSIADGSGVAGAMAKMVSTSPAVTAVIVAMLIITLLLSVLTAMSGSSRTLYQASTDGFLPKYLSKTNAHGAPGNAMWTDIAVNLMLLLISNNVFLLAISNVCYLVFNFINLQSGWIHRVDRPNQMRPYKAPAWLIAVGAIFGFVNLFFIGMGSNVFGAGVLKWGLITAFLVVPIFAYRHYIVDKGVFPKTLTEIAEDGTGAADLHVGQAKFLPYLAVAAGAAIVAIGAFLAVN